MSRQKAENENRLLQAVQFVAQVQPIRSKIPTDIYCRIFGKRISAAGPVLSASAVIEDDIECCPATHRLLSALKECPPGEPVSLTVLTSGELSVKSGNFQVAIPSIEQSELPAAYADPKTHTTSTEFSSMLHKVGSIVNDKDKHILYSSVQLLGESIVSTNGDVIFEGWHGCAAPDGPIVPKLFVKALHKVRDKTVYFLGTSEDSLTAWFPDDTWLKTKLHHDPEFPRLRNFLDQPAQFEPTPRGLWEAVERLAPFSDPKDDRLYLRQEGICTDHHETNGAINICEGLPVGISFSISSLRLISEFAESIAWNVTAGMSYFRGHNVRGAIAQRGI